MHVLRRVVVVAVAVGLAAAGVGGGIPSPATGQGAGVFRVPLGGEPPTGDPYFATDFSSGDLTFLMYTTLVGLDSAGKIVPDGARSWDVSPNGLVYTFHLRDNVQFHSGRKVAAAEEWLPGHAFVRLVQAELAVATEDSTAALAVVLEALAAASNTPFALLRIRAASVLCELT